MDNGSPYPPKDKYELLRDELQVDNDDAFHEIARQAPRPGRPRVKLTQSRKFWVGLERMSQYWDCSLDHYYEKPPALPPRPSGNGKTKSENDPLSPEAMQTDDGEGEASYPLERQPNGSSLYADAQQHQNRGDNTSATEPELTGSVYTGRRIGAGCEMPEELREETVRGLLEMVAWCFGCQATAPTAIPRLSIGNLLFPVRQSFVAGRVPVDRQIARRGILEGPLLIAQTRGDTSFREPGESPGTGQRELCDLLREVGAMLAAAQERSREGSVEVKPGEGKWWTSKPRWGGAANSGLPSEEKDKDGENGKEGPTTENSYKRSRLASNAAHSRRYLTVPARRPSAGEKWRTVQPGPGIWDKRMVYMQLGKEKESPFDDVWQALFDVLYVHTTDNF